MNKISSVAEVRHELTDSSLDVDGFIQLVNELLARYLAPDSAKKAAVSVRLARYFQTTGLLDEPFKEGREARYGARHVLQLLAVRRLMANGYSTGSLSDLLRGASDDALQRLIEGEAPRVEQAPAPEVAKSAAPAKDALDFLESIRRRSAAPPAAMPAPAPAIVPPSVSMPPGSPQLPTVPESATNWTRTPIGQGIEVHTRDDFQVPRSPHEWDILIQAFKEAINNVASVNTKKRRR